MSRVCAATWSGCSPRSRPTAGWQTLGGLLDWLLERGQQPYLIKPMPGLDVKYRLESGGPLAAGDGHLTPGSLPPAAAACGRQPRRQGATCRRRRTCQNCPWRAVDRSHSIGRRRSSMSEDYHTFVHLENAGGERVAGSDQRPGGAYYPTSAWQAGDALGRCSQHRNSRLRCRPEHTV